MSLQTRFRATLSDTEDKTLKALFAYMNAHPQIALDFEIRKERNEDGVKYPDILIEEWFHDKWVPLWGAENKVAQDCTNSLNDTYTDGITENSKLHHQLKDMHTSWPGIPLYLFIIGDMLETDRERARQTALNFDIRPFTKELITVTYVDKKKIIHYPYAEKVVKLCYNPTKIIYLNNYYVKKEGSPFEVALKAMGATGNVGLASEGISKASKIAERFENMAYLIGDIVDEFLTDPDAAKRNRKWLAQEVFYYIRPSDGKRVNRGKDLEKFLKNLGVEP